MHSATAPGTIQSMPPGKPGSGRIARRLAGWLSLATVIGGVAYVPFVMDTTAAVRAQYAKIDSRIAIVQRDCDRLGEELRRNPGTPSGTNPMLCRAGVGPHSSTDNVNAQAAAREMNERLSDLTRLSEERATILAKIQSWMWAGNMAFAGAVGATIYVVCALFGFFRQPRPASRFLPNYPAAFASGHIVVGAALGLTAAFLATKATIPEGSFWLDGIALVAGLAGETTIKSFHKIAGRISDRP